ncbi:2-C-methyl-D-erythritol 2,4-cyclodiphosphate synthase [Saccharospirillum sp. MSK14-1]|uniref:2-C-methyl-D-erythritol 2,4-cyclodiphosphate synthase n=1 Tax=Saccharospirillum sp. MSK14-1 TaxID=1897632 RepID=UPI000D33D209|nr:2-C-methyl-D-erythritol 2,4-cyclodiphosphate synthase [Saccharospirillum sp. MSK14-1]PTY37164.1 2-C-methyl-D-erythritol 2,4-cyclodiphosphate synthase [Saccharospirillum sp. MSK14-1]
MRVGQGVDVHRFDEQSEATTIRLGGVDVPAPHALLAHSDGDVLLHAVCDALLGAAGLGDIGEHFPDTDPAWAGADSRALLKDVDNTVRQRGWRLVNLDVTLIAQTPRVGDYKSAIRASIAQVLNVDLERINVKATTTEKLGFVGRKEGVAAEAICLLEPAS